MVRMARRRVGMLFAFGADPHMTIKVTQVSVRA